jgi:hypothetical protein
MNTRDVIHFGKYDAEPIEKQLNKLYVTARTYNGAGVRAFDITNEALLFALEVKGVLVERVKFTKKMLIAAYENLSMLMKQWLITYPKHDELLAELEVFKSEFTFDESAEYDLQIAAQSAIHALCLATYDVTPEEIK